ncbi:UNVERIFIED_CONTAM: Retrovirus-related Pol polyprotein from type-2 retrotransposable element R2DM [Sesamum radiatum]|uniref:Retrovirus-related Pol polyprotein from type-2 retrotransposable element R2DM n=1 Tax=Sesamum radiatum TaxID=300843 RepID=A0AAW2IZ93_SESRA
MARTYELAAVSQFALVGWGGDFNAGLDMSEVSGASGDIRVAMHEFNDCIMQTGLISLPMQGERFSWHNCSTDGRSLWKRLDRMFVNDAWLERWPNLFYTCLTPRTSDHSPLVLKGDSRDVQVSMFRFDNYLALSQGFLASVHNIWQHPVIGTPMYSVTHKLKALKPVFRQQRRKKGDLAMNVKLAAGFLEIAQKLLQTDRHNSLLLQLENCCRLVYLKATQLEHVMLRQRAKLQWLKGGDQCSKVFFRRVATRRANKRLIQISNSDGLVQTDPTIINSVFVTYFQDLLGGIEQRGSLTSTIYALGLGIFSRRKLMLLFVLLLLMMLKKLCLTLRRTKHQGQMVFPQCRLPPRCALKVDLRKAYDTVEWDFLFATLRLFGFPAVFIRWIEECVTSAHYLVVVNGGVHGFFAGARGLRQGDPMSPYLFVLVMEVLQMILQQFIDQDGQFLYHWRCRN